jgi:Tol biopolymer transport system component
MLLPLIGDRRPKPLVQTVFIEAWGEISPDGHWLAYQSNESGQFEIWVTPFPNVTTGKWQVSTSGGTQPLWARHGQELFYESMGALMRVSPMKVPADVSAWSSRVYRGLEDLTYPFHDSCTDATNDRVHHHFESPRQQATRNQTAAKYLHRSSCLR